MKRVAANAAAALPQAPSKLQQLETRVRAGLENDPLVTGDGQPHVPLAPAQAGVQSTATLDARFRGHERDGVECGTSLTARVRALYEDGVVPVREIARLCGVTERTLYTYAAHGRWRKRHARRALIKFVTRGASGRFIAREDANKRQPSGLKALDSVAAGRLHTACAEAAAIAGRAAARTLSEHRARAAREAILREFETRARRLALLTRTLRVLKTGAGRL